MRRLVSIRAGKARMAGGVAALLLGAWLAGGAVAPFAMPHADAAEPAASEAAFARARARGTLVIGVPYLAPPPAAGAKIRTPDGLDALMAERLGQKLDLPVTLRQVDAGEAARLLAAGEVDAVLASQLEGQSSPGAQAPEVARVPSGYVTRPQAVIRNDTAMRRWQDVKGRSVCMSSAAVQAQELARQSGATVRTHRVPSDALVATREGACDVAVIDDAVWAPLMRYPEWKKFSSTLTLEGPRAERVWLVASQGGQAGLLAEAMREWRRDGAWKAMTDKWARDVAFDVYLDQEVPDCHG